MLMSGSPGLCTPVGNTRAAAIGRHFHLRSAPIKFPVGTRIKTPSGRLARVMYNDEEGRVHVRYTGSDRANANEQGMFPARLLTLQSLVPEPE